jgi:excisionase family DNA binding protein
MNASVEREVMTVKEVIAFLGMDSDAVYRAVRRGTIPSIKVGRKYLIPRDFVNRMLAAKGGRDA